MLLYTDALRPASNQDTRLGQRLRNDP